MELKTDMEVLTTRREHCRNKLDSINKEMTDFINHEATSELVAEKIKEKWIKDSVTNNTRIEEVWQKNINGKNNSFQKDKMKMRNLTEESTTRKASHILRAMQISEKMKTDFTPEIENRRKM